jgi:hypothetical protein
MKTLIPFILTLFLICSRSMAQPNIEWQKCLGGSLSEGPYSVCSNYKGEILVLGESKSSDGNVNGNYGDADFWAVKLNPLGNILWSKNYGSSGLDRPNHVNNTADGGFIFCGYTFPWNGADNDVIGFHSGTAGDGWIVKVDSLGVVQWSKCLGGTLGDQILSVQQITDGYILTGSTSSNDFDVSGNHGGTNPNDVWVVKLNNFGAIQWQKCLGGTGNDGAGSVKQTLDGGFVILGGTYSNDGDVLGNHGSGDAWVVKLSPSGVIQWQKCLGGSDNDIGNSIEITSDGGYIIAGSTGSNDGDVIGNHGGNDSWALKLNSLGVIEWQKCFGGSNFEEFRSVQNLIDGGYIFSGYTSSNNGDVSGRIGGFGDVWLVKTNGNGSIQWQKCFGGTQVETSVQIISPQADNYIFVANTNSNDVNVSGNHGGGDMWLVKLSPTITESPSLSVSSELEILPNPSKGIFSLKANASMLGKGFNVFNSLGKMVTSGITSTENTAINLENQATGIYSIRFEGDRKRSLRIVKE